MAAPQTIRKCLSPGLHKLTVDADAREFAWEELYIVINAHGNVNERTGPWDFDERTGNTPLVPAYWVYVNGRKIGLWYFNRPSFRQVRAKRMKGEAQFWIEHAGEYELRFEPYRPFTVEWAEVRFEPSPDDTLLDRPALRPEAQRGLQRLFDEARLQTLAKNLDDPNFPYRALLNESFDWAMQHEDHPALPVLAVQHRLRHDAASLERVRFHIEQALALPAWGKPKEDGYAYNSDMYCAHMLRDLTIALNLLHRELGEPVVNRLLARLDRQCEIFLELALLQHGFWGGSILQDHGFISFGNFTSVAYGLLGWLPRAEHWLRFCLPRMERTLRALPTDGVIPTTSFHLVYLYTDKLVLFRDLHRQATGEDIYARPALRNLSTYCVESYDAEAGNFLHPSPRGDFTPLTGGYAFFDQMARTFDDANAAWLSGECRRLSTAQSLRGQKDFAYRLTLYAALLYEKRGEATNRPQLPPRRLRWFQDSGTVVYRDDAHGILFSTRCGAPNSRTSYANATSPCDRIIFAHVDGNFAITRHGLPLLQTGEGGCCMRTDLANVVLVDGKGQYGDDAFTMAYPDVHYGGQLIEEARLDSAAGVGYVRMQLAPAYDPAQEIETYTREWFFHPDGRMRLVDTIQVRQPHRFTWLFHTYRSHPITATTVGEFNIQNGPARLALRPKDLHCSIVDTKTVWNYENIQGGQSCHHLACETPEPVRAIKMEFELQ